MQDEVPSRVTSDCRWIVAGATLVALLLRIWPIGRLGLNHFDEGIYAMGANWARSPAGLGAIDPRLIPYAPPGYAIVAGVLSWLVGATNQALFLVSALLGAATVPVVAGLAARLGGERAAAVAAWSACLSGPHIAFSRMALTDASFLFVWAVGLTVGVRFIDRPGLVRGAAVGLAVGLAQEFKYNGWLLGALIALGAGLATIRGHAALRRRDWFALGGGTALAILLAGLLVIPWFLFVERHGGYPALLAHQRSYLGGWSDWWPHLLSQSRQAVALGGPAGLGVLNAVLIGLIAWRFDRARAGGLASGRAAAHAALTGLALWPLLAAPAVAGWFVLPRLIRGRSAAAALLVVAWPVLLVLSTFYHPYARLYLPLELAHWLVLGQLASDLGRADLRPLGASRGGRVDPIPVALGLMLVGHLAVGPGFPLAGPGPLGHPGLFEPSDSLRFAATEVVDAVPRAVATVRTLVRPAMTVDLGGRLNLALQVDLAQVAAGGGGRQWGLVDSAVLGIGPGSLAEAEARTPPPALLERWEVARTIPASLTLPTALDLDPLSLPPPRGGAYATFWLLRPRHSSPPP